MIDIKQLTIAAKPTIVDTFRDPDTTLNILLNRSEK